MITGKTLIEWGFKPGPWFPNAIEQANIALDSGQDPRGVVEALAPAPIVVVPLNPVGSLPFHLNIEAENDHEAINVESVKAHMTELMRLPTVRAGAVMPDACPAGSAPGTIPVGGVVATENAIHPGMHSADVCCSMAMTVFDTERDKTATRVLDAGMKLSHFGGGGRPRGEQYRPPDYVMEKFEANPLLKPLMSAAIEHFATQGDGNHFFFVGRLESTGQIALVTHHGSRKPGAMLYKKGLDLALKNTSKLCPEAGKHNAWIVADSEDGVAYWEALQAIKDWTMESHFKIHDLVCDHLGLDKIHRQFNAHNFVFKQSDGLFYHAKGATPAFNDELTLIPMNMAEPVLITRGKNASNGLGFAPHGAGRNFSRTAFMKKNHGRTTEELIKKYASGIDVRFFSGHPDVSELPGAYKNAASVQKQIKKFGLTDIVDRVLPIGSIMAGDWQINAPWKKKKK